MDFSYQLYSARDARSLDDTLRTLKELGYAQVEGWGGQFGDPAALAASLRNAGLAMPTAHMGFAQLEDTAGAIRIAQAVGIKTIYCPAPPSADYREGKGDWRKLAAGLEKIAGALKAAGLGFGYHNHHWEFASTADGFPMDVLLGAAPSLEWEVDVAWLIKGGEDPYAWFDRYGSRISAIHVKDIAPVGQAVEEDGWADVGFGTLDWQALVRAAMSRTRAKYFVMEHDKPSDPIRFARRSIETVTRWSLS